MIRSFFRHFLGISTSLALLLLLASRTAALANETLFPASGEIVADDVNIRAGNNLNYEILIQVHRNDTVTILAQRDDWYQINLPAAATCYINASFVALQSGRADRGTVTASHVNLRARPATSSSILGQLNEGEQVAVRTQDGDWLAIVPPTSSTGWVHTKFVKISRPSPFQPVPISAQPIAATASNGPATQIATSTQPPVGVTTTVTADVSTTRSTTPTTPPLVPSTAVEVVTPLSQEHDATPSSASALTGTIEDLGRLVARPARHKLVRDHRIVAFLVSERYNLNRFLHRPVHVWGETISPTDRRIPLIRVDRIEPSAKLP